jgi:hypothetical protein
MGLWLVCRARLLGSGLQNLARRQFFVAGRLRLPANQRRKDERASGLGQARPPRRWLALYDDPPPASGQVDGLVKREVFRTVDVIGDFAQQRPSKWNALSAAVEIPHNVDAKPRSHDHWAVFHLVELPFQFGKRPNEIARNPSTRSRYTHAGTTRADTSFTLLPRYMSWTRRRTQATGVVRLGEIEGAARVKI